MNILLNSRHTGRIAKALIDCFIQHSNISFTCVQDFFKSEPAEALEGHTHMIALAWDTSPGYKDSERNYDYMRRTLEWLEQAKMAGVHSTYLGTSDKSGFGDCLYKQCKDALDPAADMTIKIPFVWQPSREGSLPYKVVNGLEYELDKTARVSYVTEGQVVDMVLATLDCTGVVDMAGPRLPLQHWIEQFGRAG
jgi:hypothetical protein